MKHLGITPYILFALKNNVKAIELKCPNLCLVFH